MTTNLDNHYWKPILTTKPYNQFWQPILITNLNNQFWKPILTTNLENQSLNHYSIPWQPMLTSNLDNNQNCEIFVKSSTNLCQILKKHDHSPMLIQEMLVHLKIGSSASSPIWGKLNRNGKLSKKLLNYSDWNWQFFATSASESNLTQTSNPTACWIYWRVLVCRGSLWKNAFAVIFLLGWTKRTTFQKRRKELRDKRKKNSKYRRGTVQLDPVSCPPRLIISYLIKIPEILNEALCQIRP